MYNSIVFSLFLPFYLFKFYADNHHHNLILNILADPKRNSDPISSHSPFLPTRPHSPTPVLSNHQLSPSTNSPVRDVPCVLLCNWLLSLSILFSGVIHVVVFISISFSQLTNNILQCDGPHLVYPFISLWHLACLHFLVVTNNKVMNSRMQILMWIQVSVSLGSIT